MDDIRLSAGLPAHPKVRKLLRLLGPAAGWSWVVLLIWTGTNRPTGDLGGLDDDDLEIAADWTGKPGAFVEALRALRMLDGGDLARKIHDWAQHNPYAAGKAERVAKARLAAGARWSPARTRAIARSGAMPSASGENATSINEHKRVFREDATSINEQCPLPEHRSNSKSEKQKLSTERHSPDNSRAADARPNGKSARVSLAVGQEAKRSAAPADVAEAIAKALNLQGISCTGAHPEIVALVAQGGTVAEFDDAAAEASRRGKPMLGYVLGIVRGRRRDAATAPPAVAVKPHLGPSPEQPAEPPEVANRRMLEHLERLTGPS